MNDNFKFINGIDLSDKQINEVTNLLFDTGYYQESALNCKSLDFI